MTDLDRRPEIDVTSVANAFDRAAPRYDLMVGLNPGYHRHLAEAAAAVLEPLTELGHRRPLRLLDLGCGSGASTRALLRELRRRGLRAEVIGIDASTGMLARAARRSWPKTVRFLPGRAEDLVRVAAGAGVTEVDGVLAAYLFRNVTDADATLAQVHRLLRPGGVLVGAGVFGRRVAAGPPALDGRLPGRRESLGPLRFRRSGPLSLPVAQRPRLRIDQGVGRPDRSRRLR